MIAVRVFLSGMNLNSTSNVYYHNHVVYCLYHCHRYNFIGLCTTIKGAFPKLLESLSVGNAFTEALECMELRHLGKLIHLVVIPLVKHCPREILEEWTVNLLEPILLECEGRLHGTWFYLLYKRQAYNLFSYGNLVGEDEQINKMGYKLLLEFT